MENPSENLKYSDLLAEWLVELGYTHCFMVAGGGCMHLIDGFRKRFQCIPVVHEVAAGIAAEHFNECSFDRKAFALVTTGPGMTNVVTAIAGCFAEHRELLVIAGQVKSTDLRTPPIRQLGVQEVDGQSLTDSISVASTTIDSPIGRNEFQDIVRQGWGPHPGPVMIEVCLDVQGAPAEKSQFEQASQSSSEPVPTSPVLCDDDLSKACSKLAEVISNSQRPLFLLGGLVTRAVAWSELDRFEALGIPVLTTTSALDRIPESSSIYAGRTGTWGGQRAANLLLAQADVVVAIGAQLDLQQTGFNTREYALNADLYQVFPCDGELSKPEPKLTGSLCALPDEALSAILSAISWTDLVNWLPYVKEVRELLPALEPHNQPSEGYPHAIEFLRNLSLASSSEDILTIASSGLSFTEGLRVSEIARCQFATTSAAFASMGYGLATAIGACFARPGKTSLLVEGDGGFSQNLQELATISRHNLPVKIFIFDNRGYASIRATQRKFFNGAYVGCDEETGLGFPDWNALFGAFGIRSRNLSPQEISIENLDGLIHENLEPEAWILEIDPVQSNWPAIASRILLNGGMESAPLHEMSPPLEDDLREKVTRFL